VLLNQEFHAKFFMHGTVNACYFLYATTYPNMRDTRTPPSIIADYNSYENSMSFGLVSTTHGIVIVTPVEFIHSFVYSTYLYWHTSVTSVKRSNMLVCTVAGHCVCTVLKHRLKKIVSLITQYNNISITFLLRNFSLLIKFIFVIKWIQAFSHKNMVLKVNWHLIAFYCTTIKCYYWSPKFWDQTINKPKFRNLYPTWF